MFKSSGKTWIIPEKILLTFLLLFMIKSGLNNRKIYFSIDLYTSGILLVISKITQFVVISVNNTSMTSVHLKTILLLYLLFNKA